MRILSQIVCILIFANSTPTTFLAQTIKNDSLRIESASIQAIGKITIIDSVQKTELENIQKKMHIGTIYPNQNFIRTIEYSV
jgi:hypothetical protein